MLFSKNKEIERTTKQLVKECGWKMKDGGSHVCLYQPETGRLLTVPFSPSCARASLNWHAQLRRMIRAVNGAMPKMRGVSA